MGKETLSKASIGKSKFLRKTKYYSIHNCGRNMAFKSVICKKGKIFSFWTDTV